MKIEFCSFINLKTFIFWISLYKILLLALEEFLPREDELCLSSSLESLLRSLELSPLLERLRSDDFFLSLDWSRDLLPSLLFVRLLSSLPRDVLRLLELSLSFLLLEELLSSLRCLRKFKGITRNSFLIIFTLYNNEGGSKFLMIFGVAARAGGRSLTVFYWRRFKGPFRLN